MRQRKALSRTSSNILLNSVQMAHNVHNLNQYHHINNYNHPNECELTSKLKDLKEEDSQQSVSNIEVMFAYVYLIFAFQLNDLNLFVEERKMCVCGFP